MHERRVPTFFQCSNWSLYGKYRVKMSKIASSSSKKFSGGCQCGGLRYAILGSFGEASICHCRMCQKAFGNFGAALVNVPYSNFQWTRGAAKEFRSSAVVTRGFCQDCGTPMFMREDGDENIEIAIGTLDIPSAVPPMIKQSAIESQVSWFSTLHQLPTETMSDYRTPEDLLKLKSFQHPDFDT
jgi:hypothetical protein